MIHDKDCYVPGTYAWREIARVLGHSHFAWIDGEIYRAVIKHLIVGDARGIPADWPTIAAILAGWDVVEMARHNLQDRHQPTCERLGLLGEELMPPWTEAQEAIRSVIEWLDSLPSPENVQQAVTTSKRKRDAETDVATSLVGRSTRKKQNTNKLPLQKQSRTFPCGDDGVTAANSKPSTEDDGAHMEGKPSAGMDEGSTKQKELSSDGVQAFAGYEDPVRSSCPYVWDYKNNSNHIFIQALAKYPDCFFIGKRTEKQKREVLDLLQYAPVTLDEAHTDLYESSKLGPCSYGSSDAGREREFEQLMNSDSFASHKDGEGAGDNGTPDTINGDTTPAETDIPEADGVSKPVQSNGHTVSDTKNRGNPSELDDADLKKDFMTNFLHYTVLYLELAYEAANVHAASCLKVLNNILEELCELDADNDENERIWAIKQLVHLQHRINLGYDSDDSEFTSSS